MSDKYCLSAGQIMFKSSFDHMAEECHNTALEKGWWESGRGDGEVIALIHSELSEALEGLRHGNPPDDKVPEFTAAEAELADAIIRIMDFSVHRGFRVAEAVVAKAEFNKSRQPMHGKKF